MIKRKLCLVFMEDGISLIGHPAQTCTLSDGVLLWLIVTITLYANLTPTHSR